MHQRTNIKKSFSLAPMVGYTHKHFRILARLLSKKTLLYTEMLPAQAVIRNANLASAYMDSEFENPLACQISGNDPKTMAQAAKILEQRGASEININVGCPSDKVQSGQMGACLMLNPHLVGDIFQTMQNAVKIPVSIKCRLGVDEQNIYEDLDNFIQITQNAGCNYYIIHARKAWLRGLSPKDNRTIPPLDYDRVRQIKQNNPNSQIILNGGILDLTTAKKEFDYFDGVMLGRAIQKNIFLLADVDSMFFGENYTPKRQEVFLQYIQYMQKELAKGQKLSMLIAPLLTFFHGVKGGKQVKTSLTFAKSFDDVLNSVKDFEL